MAANEESGDTSKFGYMFNRIKTVSLPVFQHFFEVADSTNKNTDNKNAVQKLQDKVNVEIGTTYSFPVRPAQEILSLSIPDLQTDETRSFSEASAYFEEPGSETTSFDPHNVPPVSAKPVSFSNQDPRRGEGGRTRSVHFDKPVQMRELQSFPGSEEHNKSEGQGTRNKGVDFGNRSLYSDFESGWRGQRPSYGEKEYLMGSEAENTSKTNDENQSKVVSETESDSSRTRTSGSRTSDKAPRKIAKSVQEVETNEPLLFQKSSREFFTSHTEESNFLHKLFSEKKLVKPRKSAPCREVKCCARNESNAGCQPDGTNSPSLPGDNYVWTGDYVMDHVTALPLLQKTGSEVSLMKRESMEYMTNPEDNKSKVVQPCRAKLTRPCRDEDCCTNHSNFGSDINWEKSDKVIAYQRNLKEKDAPEEEPTPGDENNDDNSVVKFFKKKSREFGLSKKGAPYQQTASPKSTTPARSSPIEDSARSGISLAASSGASSQRESSQTASGTTIASFMARDLAFPCNLDVSNIEGIPEDKEIVDTTPMHLRDRSKLLDKTTFFKSTSVQCVSTLSPEGGICKYKKEDHDRDANQKKPFAKSCQERLEDEIENEWRHKKAMIFLLIINIVLMLCATVLVNYLIATYVEIYGILEEIHDIFNEWKSEYLP